MTYRIRKNDTTLKGKIKLTPSKSISNRLLIIQALCPGKFQIRNLATANDTLLLQKLLSTSSSVLNAEDAGTTFRFLTAYLSQKPGEWLLTGTERMKERPISMLVDALRKLGAEISYAEKEKFPPLKIKGKKLKGGEIEIDGNVSSQFISALLMIAPTLENGLKLKLTGDLSSQPYIEMTLKLMKLFGTRYEQKGKMIVVPKKAYQPVIVTVESDWSAASYWYEMAALAGDVDLTIPGLQKDSVQGDSVIAEIMKQFGVETDYNNEGIRLTKKSSSVPQKFSHNFQSCPDLVQGMAVTCASLGVSADFKGVKSLRIKETDRLAALKVELTKMDVPAIISEFGMQVSGYSAPKFPGSAFKTYSDHRMAMSFAPLALKFGQIEIEDPDVVKKSYPEFWNDLRSVGFDITEI